MYRRYEGRWQRFAQPDPYDGSYDLSNPQSLNRYAYVQNDPVSFTDPTGLQANNCDVVEGRTICYDPSDTIRINNSDRYFDILFGIRSRFGGYQIDREPIVRETPQSPTPAEHPQLPPCNVSGSGSIDFSLITPIFLGPSLGIQFDNRGVYISYGLTAGIPRGPGLAIMGGTSPVSSGVNVTASGGSVTGATYSANISNLRHGSWSYGGTTPNLSVGINVVIPVWRRECQ
jgi:hypothetical protein